MPARWTPLDHFLRAVHRRYVVLRVVEYAALGLLAGAVAATILAALLIWRGQDASTVVGAALAVGAACGAAWGIQRTPSTIAAAVEADRQLRTSDLLSTAWTLRQTHGGFAQTVLAQAAAHAARVAPSSVILHRLGVRAWSGVALTVGFAWTLAALSSASLEARSTQDSLRRPTSAAATRARPARPLIELVVDDRRLPRRVAQNPQDARDPLATSADPATTPPPENTDDTGSNDLGEHASTGASSGTGADAGKTPVSDPPVASASPGSREQADAASNPDRASAGGVGRGATNPSTDGDVAGGIVRDTSTAAASPPWQDPVWPLAVQSAQRAIEQRRVPDGYRDLVRGYFGGDDLRQTPNQP